MAAFVTSLLHKLYFWTTVEAFKSSKFDRFNRNDKALFMIQNIIELGGIKNWWF